MSEENKNHFIYRTHFPDSKSILARKGKSTKEIFKNALFVLDANTLLAPYNIGKENTEEIKKIFQKLIRKNRLYIPEHALREFAKNRSLRISGLFTHIDNQLSEIPSIKSFEYPILGELEAYKKLKESREDISVKIKEYKQNLTNLKKGITEWNWSDPVTSMYQSIFTDEIILKPTSNEADLISEYSERIENDIPPGNKDKSKENNAIGDFVIWKCILELGKREKKDIIFISNDEKNDWLLKGNKKPISTRFELVDEFYRFTGGNDFISINFKNFLDYQGLDIEFGETFNDIINKELKKNRNYTLNSLREIEDLINQYFILREDDPDEYVYIPGDDLNEYINGFKKSYQREYSDSKEWQYYFDYFFLFDEWLTEIKALNDEIKYQEHRMKRDTRTELIKLIALCKEFLNKYSKFKLIT